MQMIEYQKQSGHRRYCDGKQHYVYKNDKLIYKLPCGCPKDKKWVAVDLGNGPNEMYSRKPQGYDSFNYTGD